MVSINNNISGLGVGNLNNSHTVVRPKTDNANSLQSKQVKQDFSTVLDNKNLQASQQKKTQQPAPEVNTYSPLMMRYGPNKINEIKNIAEQTGIQDLTNEDFDYAIRYGRSILADYLV